MTANKTPYQKAAGKLISVIQKEWGDDLGGAHADFSENVMDAAHDLLQAGTPHDAKALLSGKSVLQYLGEIWVQAHPDVKPAAIALEELIRDA